MYIIHDLQDLFCQRKENLICRSSNIHFIKLTFWQYHFFVMNKFLLTEWSNSSTVNFSSRYHHAQYSGAPNGSFPQNISSSGKLLLAGGLERIICHLRGKCCWEIDNSWCLRGFYVSHWREGFRPWAIPSFLPTHPSTPLFPTEGLSSALWPHLNWPIMSGHTTAGKLWELFHQSCWEWGTDNFPAISQNS